jgi:hypothetical protein
MKNGARLRFSVFLFLGVLGSLALQASGPSGLHKTLTGTLVDITCATDPKRDLAKLRSQHTRKCLLMPVCAESGYALLTDDDEILKFNASGNNLVRKLLAKRSRAEHWRVSVVGIVQEERLTVSHLKLVN